MKKQIKKLSLNKKTISNLTASEMFRIDGGDINAINNTKNAKTCAGHHTCNTCAGTLEWCAC